MRVLTPRDQNLDYSSPGSVVRYNSELKLFLQTYPRPNYTTAQMPQYGTSDARLFIMRSTDLSRRSAPELLRVKGPTVDEKAMGRRSIPIWWKIKMNPENGGVSINKMV